MAAVVADASVLIALRQIGQIALLEKLFGEVLIPPAVAREIAPSLPGLPHWVRIREVERPLHGPVEDALLDPGETEAIQLALRTNAGLVILAICQLAVWQPSSACPSLGRRAFSSWRSRGVSLKLCVRRSTPCVPRGFA